MEQNNQLNYVTYVYSYFPSLRIHILQESNSCLKTTPKDKCEKHEVRSNHFNNTNLSPFPFFFSFSFLVFVSFFFWIQLFFISVYINYMIFLLIHTYVKVTPAYTCFLSALYNGSDTRILNTMCCQDFMSILISS